MNRSVFLFGLISFLVASITGEQANPGTKLDLKNVLLRGSNAKDGAETVKFGEGSSFGHNPSDHMAPDKSYAVSQNSAASINNPDDGKFRSTTEKAHTVLIGNTFCLFAPNITQENKQCLYDSILFSDLAASSQVPLETPEAMEKWYQKFDYYLSIIGWRYTSFDAMSSLKSLTPVEIGQSQFSASTEFEKILAKLVAKSYFPYLGSMKLVDNFKAMVNAVENDKSGRYASVYSNCTRKYKTSFFNIVVATQSFDSDPMLIMRLFKLGLTTSPNTINALWSPYPAKSVRLLYGQEQMHLVKDLFNQAIIEEKLGDRLKYDILDIPI